MQNTCLVLFIENAIPVRGRFHPRHGAPVCFRLPAAQLVNPVGHHAYALRGHRNPDPYRVQQYRSKQGLPLTSNFLPWRRPPNPTGSQKSARRNFTTVLPMTSGDMPDAKSPATRPPALAPTAKLTWHTTSKNFGTSSSNPGPQAFVFS